MAAAPKVYTASVRIGNGGPKAVESAVRQAVVELQETLTVHGIEASFMDISLLGHSEAWDNEGQRWVHVRWDA